jgi:hypothetical protein
MLMPQICRNTGKKRVFTIQRVVEEERQLHKPPPPNYTHVKDEIAVKEPI